MKINATRVVFAGLAAFIATVIVASVGGEVLIGSIFTANAAAMRSLTERQMRLPYLLATLMVSDLAFAYLYARGYSYRNGVGEGIKLGVLLAVLAALGEVGQWLYFPITAAIPSVLIPFHFIESAIGGVAIAVVYKPSGPIA